MKTDKKDTKIVISSRQWIMAGIKDGSIIITDNGLILNASAFSSDSARLVKKAQYAGSIGGGAYQPDTFGNVAGRSMGYGIPGGIASGMKGKGLTPKGMITPSGAPAYTTSRLFDAFGNQSTFNSLEGVQGQVKTTLVPDPSGSGTMVPSVTGNQAPTAGVRMGLKQPFSATGTAYSAARSGGSGRVMSGLKAVAPGVKAIPGGVSTAAKGLAGAAASGGFRGFMAGNVISAAGSIGAWGIHQGLIAAYDWSRGANVISGAMRTPKGAQDFNKAQEILAQKVMPMMYGHAAGPNEKLVNLNSYIASMTKELESDPGYQAALSGQVPNVMATEALPEDLSAPVAGGGEFNPANQ